MADISVIILTYNEEIHIARALASVLPFAREVFVIDSFSTDRTADLAEAAGAVVLQNPFVNQAKQFQWAMENAPISAGWILRLDADEVIEPDLAREIEEGLQDLPLDVTGINLQRKHIFMERWIRHGGRYPLTMLRIFRNGKGVMEDRWMDEHLSVSDGRVVTFSGGFADHNLKNLSFLIDKHNKYATREAIDVLNARLQLFEQRSTTNAQSSSSHVGVKRWIKVNIYDRLPLALGPASYFFYRYFFQLGFLDGKPGLIYHFIQGFSHRFTVGAKIYELERQLSVYRTREEKKAALERIVGFRL